MVDKCLLSSRSRAWASPLLGFLVGWVCCRLEPCFKKYIQYIYYYFCLNHNTFCLRKEKCAMDRLGDLGLHQHLGSRQNATGSERREQNWTHFFHHIQPAGLPGLLPNTWAVPDEAEATQIRLQAVLPKQVCITHFSADDGNLWAFVVLFTCLLFLFLNCSLRGHEQVRCKFYNELGRILVKDFESLMQLDEMSLEAEEFPPYQEMGKVSENIPFLYYFFFKAELIKPQDFDGNHFSKV